MQEQVEKNALQVGADVARDAATVAKIAAQAASGNVAGAAVTAIKNASLLKKAFCAFLAIVLLITCCICSVPNMIWEAAEQTKDSVSAMVENATETAANNIYFVFYGTSDGHEGLTGILSALPRALDTLLDVAKAGWEFFTTGEISDESRSQMSESTQLLINKVYSDEDKYFKEAQAGVLSGSDGSTGMKLAITNKQLVTQLRIGGHVDDLKDSINDDFQKQVASHGGDVNTCHISESGSASEAINAILALYTIQTGGDLSSVTVR